MKLDDACCSPCSTAHKYAMVVRGPSPVLHTCMQVLTGRARVEAEDAQRVLLAALNGLAGLMLLEGEPKLAVATYRQAGPCTSARDCMCLRVLDCAGVAVGVHYCFCQL